MRKLLLTAAAVSAAAPALRAQITFYDIPDQTITFGTALYLDFDGGSTLWSNSDFAGRDVGFNFTGAEAPRAFGGYWDLGQANDYLTRYAFGAEMSFAAHQTPSYFEKIYDDGYGATEERGNWKNDAGEIAYVGALNWSDNREAWVAVQYDDLAGTLKVLSFAVAPGSANMTAGAVPEPAETAMFMALLAGGAAVYHRRRKLRQAA